MRFFLPILLLVTAMPISAADARTPGASPERGREIKVSPDRAVPELEISIEPVDFGYAPLAGSGERRLFRFQVLALDPERAFTPGSVEVLLRRGDARHYEQPLFGQPDSRIRGTVRLGADGHAQYVAEVLLNGRIAARTRATVDLRSSQARVIPEPRPN